MEIFNVARFTPRATFFSQMNQNPGYGLFKKIEILIEK